MRILGVVFVAALLAAAGALAKEIPPGALMVCGAMQCRTVTEAADAKAFSTLLWGEGRVARAPAPRVGSAIYQLRFEDGPAGAIVSTTAIRVHGLNCGRFQRGKWYRLPTRLGRLTAGLKPKRLRASVPRSC